MRIKKMTLEAIIIILVIIAGLLAALALRLSYDNSDWAALAEELQDKNDVLRENTRELCKEKLSLVVSIDELETENEHLNNRLNDVLTELERQKAAAISQQEEPETVAGYVTAEEILQANAKERLPAGHTNVISGMPYTTITNKKSEQWALQLAAYTGKYGIRCYFDGDHIYFLSAMGSAYGRTIGDAFRVTLKCGTVLYVMLAEFKDDGTDPNFFGHPAQNYDEEIATCILEFIYDPEKIDAKVRGENGSGTFTVFEEFGGLYGDGGDISKIEYIGRKWRP